MRYYPPRLMRALRDRYERALAGLALHGEPSTMPPCGERWHGCRPHEGRCNAHVTNGEPRVVHCFDYPGHEGVHRPHSYFAMQAFKEMHWNKGGWV